MPDQFEKLKSFLSGKVMLLNVPMIEIKPIAPNPEIIATFNQFEKFNWLIFTSMRGVQNFFELFENIELDRSLLQKIKIACIGMSTNHELKKYGFEASYINEGNTSKDFSKYLIDSVLKENDNVLLPLGERADTYLPETLNNFCNASRIDVYKTIDTNNIDSEILNVIISDHYDLLVFTSPSAFENFIKLTDFKPTTKELKIATIGEKTAKSIEKLGFNVRLIPEKATLEGLATEIIEYLNQKQHS
ncbi:MAG: uroporphyrinogen-III synthase [Bacteroidales bacterium]|nr:uroporphyrinogen-III synthase [Bacteroidales bacterium]